MRTNIIIDDALMASAMAAGSFTTKKEAVEEGLKLLARRAVYDRILALRGKVKWSLDGDWTVDAMPPEVTQELTASKLVKARRATHVTRRKTAPTRATTSLA